MRPIRAIVCAAAILSASTPLMAKMRSDKAARRAEAEHACYGDAQSLCPDAIPDEAKVTACMTRKRAQLSPACRAILDEGL